MVLYRHGDCTSTEVLPWKCFYSLKILPSIISILYKGQILLKEPLNYLELSRSGLVVRKHGLYVGGPGWIPTAITTRTAAGGDAEHVSLNHWLASTIPRCKIGTGKNIGRTDTWCQPCIGCKLPICTDHLKVIAHTKVGWVHCQG